ncbi:Elongation factor Ts, mitochondrial [Quillaja saponaria]|uniref:Elongation factor Ts, mitochondrial n=1 Tax=Quillaja saponaria TaxID=32244 RepID=A0AAD7VFJ3_QUISA|nr:Elongation factor Ts, mitochondrial [Quillaja saponaria]
MMPVIPCSISSVSLIPGTAFMTRKNNSLNIFGLSRKPTIHHRSSLQRFLLLPLSSVRLFPQYSRTCLYCHKSRTHIVSATGTNVEVEKPDSSIADEDSREASEIPSDAVVVSEELSPNSDASLTSTKTRHSRPARKSDMPPVKNEDLIPGATFTGKVKSIQPFGAFIDFGAFTDGLVHVSRLSDNYIKDVGTVVSVGQEVQQRKDAHISSDKADSGRRNISRPNPKKGEVRKSTKFVKGQDLEGTVKNLTRSGAFISLPDGEEGFLPTSEEDDEGFGNIMGTSSLQVGQELNVRVLRITRGQRDKMQETIEKPVVPKTSEEIEGNGRQGETVSNITEVQDQPAGSKKEKDSVPSTVNNTGEDNSKKEVDTADDEKDPESIISSSTASVSGTAENEAEVSSGISAPEQDVSTANEIIEEAPPVDLVGSSERTGSPVEEANEILSPESQTGEDIIQIEAGGITTEDEAQLQTSNAENEVPSPTPTGSEEMEPKLDKNGSITKSSVQPDVPSPLKTAESHSAEDVEINVNEIQEVQPSAQSEISSASQVDDKGSLSKAAISPALVKQLREETGAGMMDCKKAVSETGGDIAKAQEFLRKKGLASAENKASRATAEGRIGSYIHDSRIGILVEANCETDFVSRGDIFKELVDDLAMQVAACPQVKYLVTEDVPDEIVNKEKEIEMQKEDLLSKPKQIRSKIVEERIRKRLEELALLEQPTLRMMRSCQDFAAEVAAQTAAKPVSTPGKEQPAALEAKETVEKPPTVTVSATLVKQLREETGAGMMDCKKALSETGGDLQKAQEYLRKKGLSSAEKKASRLVAGGRIGSYIHDSRIGVLIEVNCETDFVGRSEKFKELADDLAMQVVACPQVQFVSVEDIPESIVQKEKELEMQREDILSKPENIRERIVEGRVSKRLGELALLEQPLIKNDNVMVKDLVKQTVAALGENIKVRRFVRFTLGESIDNEETKSA